MSSKAFGAEGRNREGKGFAGSGADLESRPNSSDYRPLISQDWGFVESPDSGSEHCNSTPISSNSDILLRHNVVLSRSKSDKKGISKHTLKLDKLSESEKRRIIEDIVKIQDDGTVKVDVACDTLVAPELLELDNGHSTPCSSGDTIFELNKTIPKLNIAMLIVGTRGDVQPFIAFAKRLQEFGHRVRLATHDNFRKFVTSHGVEFYPLGGDPRILTEYMARNRSFLLAKPAQISIQRRQLKEVIFSLLPACTEPDLETGASFRAQAIIANPPAYGQVHVAEALGVPLHIFFTMPWTPTHEFPHPMAHVPHRGANKLSYILVDLAVWLGIRSFINDFRKRMLKLPPIAYISTYYGSISHLPTGYMWSPHLVPKPKDWGALVDVVGFSFLNLGTKYQPQNAFTEWIQQGTMPIYVGFGSMPLEDGKMTMRIILEALKATGRRGIIGRGWGDLGTSADISEDVFLIEDCPHDWLFPQCAAVVHHGGAGTIAEGLRAGCPTTVIPFFGDQIFWGNWIHQNGVGPAPIPIYELNVEQLSNAIRFMLEPEVKIRAMKLAKQIKSEDGAARAVNVFHRHLPQELPTSPNPSDEPTYPHNWLVEFKVIEKWCCLPFSP